MRSQHRDTARPAEIGAHPDRSGKARQIAIAVACHDSGRVLFASLDSTWFRRIDHFPANEEEAVELYESSIGPKLLRDELAANFKEGLVVLCPENR